MVEVDSIVGVWTVNTEDNTYIVATFTSHRI